MLPHKNTAKKSVSSGCKEFSCERTSASETKCKNNEYEVILFLRKESGGTPDFHAVGRKVGREQGFNTTLLHEGITGLTGITDIGAHLEEEFEGFTDEDTIRRRFCRRRRVNDK